MSSHSDKIFQKRKAKKKTDLSRHEPSRRERRRALIVCEGSKTEPNYLRALTAYLGLTTADVKVCGECGSSPISVVDFGEKTFDDDPDYEMVFFVFDRDSHPSYDKAVKKIKAFQEQDKSKEVKFFAITSIPCFEIWYLLHFECHEKPCDAAKGKSPCDNLISRLKKWPGFEGYGKGKDSYFSLLQGRLSVARRNAKITLRASEDRGDREHHGNPTTRMHILVDELEAIASENNL